MKSVGFVLIELLISILISSFIMMGLFTSFFQLRTAMVTADYFVSVYQRAVLVNQQFDRDLAGAFKPVQAEKEKEEKKQSEGQASKADEQKAKTDEQKKTPTLTHIFYGTVKNKQFELLTCITSNPLQVYWSDRAGEAKPRMARIVYRLLKEKGEPVSYRMVRQEGYKPLEWAAFIPEAAKKIREIELISGIKECIVSYTVAVEKKAEKGLAEKEDTKNKKKKTYEYKESKEWKLPEKEKAEETEKKEQEKKEPQKELPDFVTMKLVLWDDTKTRDVPFEFTWAVGRALVGQLDIEKEEEEKPEKKPGEQMPQTKEEAKQRFGEIMRKLNALKEKTAGLHQFATNRMPGSGMRRFAANGMPVSVPGSSMVPRGQQAFEGVGVQQGVQQTNIPGIMHVGDWTPPVTSSVGVASGVPVSAQTSSPMPIDMGGMPPEYLEQLYAYYNDMPLSEMDMRGI